MEPQEIELLAAINEEDSEKAMNAAEAFLVAYPIQIEDDRRGQIIEAYNSAFIAWFVAVGNADTARTQERIKTFRELLADSSQGG